jgi:DNA-binding transcriptional MerR regulator
MTADMVVERRWMSAEEVADALGVSVHTVRSWRRRGQGPPFYRMFTAIRYDRAEVRTWHRATHHPGGGPIG